MNTDTENTVICSAKHLCGMHTKYVVVPKNPTHGHVCVCCRHRLHGCECGYKLGGDDTSVQIVPTLLPERARDKVGDHAYWLCKLCYQSTHSSILTRDGQSKQSTATATAPTAAPPADISATNTSTASTTLLTADPTAAPPADITAANPSTASTTLVTAERAQLQVEKTSQPYKETVTFDKIPLYELRELDAARMYHESACKPIALACMGIGVPGFPKYEEDAVLQQNFKRSRASLYKKTEILPNNKTTGKPFLMKEVMRRAVLAGLVGEALPQPKNHTIPMLISWLEQNQPPQSEHEFIVRKMTKLLQSLHDHFMSHSCTAESALNRAQRYIEVLMDRDLRKDWEERDMQKNRQVLEAECHHSEQCQTNEHLKSFWDKASELYNNPEKAYTSRVFPLVKYGKPFHEAKEIIPVEFKFHVQPESFRKKYTESRGEIDRIRRQMHKSGEGEGSLAVAKRDLKECANSDHDAYIYLVLEEEDQLDQYCLSFTGKHAAGMKKNPLTSTASTKKGKKAKKSPSTPAVAGADAINSLVTHISNFGESSGISERLRDMNDHLRADEAALSQSRKDLVQFSDKLGEAEDHVEEGKYTRDSFRYKNRKIAYDACNEQISELVDRINKSKDAISLLETERKNAFITPKKVAANNQSETEEIVLRGFSDDESSNRSNPFSNEMTLNDEGIDGIDIDEEIDDEKIGFYEQFDK